MHSGLYCSSLCIHLTELDNEELCVCAAAPVAETVGGAFQVLGLELQPSQQLMSLSSAACIPIPIPTPLPIPRLAKLKAIKVRIC